MRAEQGRRATRCWRRSCRWSPRRSAAARRSSGWPTGVGLVRAGGHRRRGRWPSSPGRSAGPEPRFAYALVAAVAVLIIACPCALGPRDADVDHGRRRPRRAGRRADQERRGARAVEKVDTLVVDKTGTLTEGKPKVTAIVPAAGFDEDELLRLAASARARQRASAGGRDRARPRRSAALALAAGDGLRLADRQGRARHGRRASRSRSATRALPGRARHRRRRRWRRAPRRCAATAQTAMFVAVDGKPAGVARRRRPDQGDDAGGARGAARRRHARSSC